MRKTLSVIAMTILAATVLDLAILFTAMAQIAIEGRTGHWNPFWRYQAEQVVRLLR